MSKEEFKGTKGKWKVGRNVWHEPMVYVDCKEISTGMLPIAKICMSELEGSEITPNAYLIATAPELLKACISARDYLQDLYDSNESAPFPTRSELDRLNEAINKVTTPTTN